MSSELGNLLREARLAKNLTIDEIQEMTKIRSRYLQAIEDGKFQILPGQFYVRAFIKSYAETLGLDPVEVLSYYEKELPKPSPEPKLEPIRRRKPAVSAGPAFLTRWISKILFYSFLVLVIFLIYNFISNNSGNGTDPISSDEMNRERITNEQPETVQPPVPKQPEPEPLPEPAPKPPEPKVTYLRTEKRTDYYSVADTNKLIIEIKAARGDNWFKLTETDRNGKIIESYTMRKGESKTWELETSSAIYLGAANQVDITVNGFPINTSDKGDLYYYQFNLLKNNPAP